MSLLGGQGVSGDRSLRASVISLSHFSKPFLVAKISKGTLRKIETLAEHRPALQTLCDPDPFDLIIIII
jgi:hypothetical protein